MGRSWVLIGLFVGAFGVALIVASRAYRRFRLRDAFQYATRDYANRTTPTWQRRP